MNRREKRDLIKELGSVLDELLVAAVDVPAPLAAKAIDVLKRCDEGVYLDHRDRKFHAAVQSGKIKLEITVNRP